MVAWSPVTFSCFQNWRDPWIDGDMLGRKILLEELKTIPKVLRGLGKALAQVYYIWGGLLWRGQYRYWQINKYFSRKIKMHRSFWTGLVLRQVMDHCFLSSLNCAENQILPKFWHVDAYYTCRGTCNYQLLYINSVMRLVSSHNTQHGGHYDKLYNHHHQTNPQQATFTCSLGLPAATCQPIS